MALNLADRLVVIQASHMQTRVTAAVANYALYLLGFPEGAQAGNPRTAATVNELGWAREAIRNPSASGASVAFHLLDDTNFLDDGSDITDVQLKGAVESVINTRFIAAAE